MTRILFIISTSYQSSYAIEDPRPALELVKLINTGRLVIARDDMTTAKRTQYAVAAPDMPVVLVFHCPPPVRLGARHYDVLYAMAAGERAEKTAQRLGISRRTVYAYVAEIKERFGLYGREELLEKAARLGLVLLKPRPRRRPARVSKVTRANRGSIS